jgi:hypothetical protein
MPSQPAPQQSTALSYVDHPEIAETFVNSIEKMWVDGPIVRIEFVVNRIDPVVPGSPPTGNKHTACRLVLPITSLPMLAGQLNGLMQTLVQQGVMQPMPMPPAGKPN